MEVQKGRIMADRKYTYYKVGKNKVGKNTYLAVDWTGPFIIAIALPVVLLLAGGLARLAIWIIETIQRLT